VDKGEPLGKHPEFRRLRGVPLSVHHWDGASADEIRWVREVLGSDAEFLAWLRAGSSTKFLRWLQKAGPEAVNYFREVFRAGR